MAEVGPSVWDWAMPKGLMGKARTFDFPEEIACESEDAGRKLRRQLGEAFPSILRQDREGFAEREDLERGEARERDGQSSGSIAGENSIREGMRSSRHPASPPAIPSTLDEEWRRAEERGRLAGFEEGAATVRQAIEQRLAAERQSLQSQILALTEDFASQRETYFHQMEREVASLSLSIAARILRREAEMDPLLLTGAVRAALGQLSGSTVVRLCVPVEDEALWRENLAAIPGLRQQPQVVGNADLRRGECRLESDLGTADLGVWTQLKEIERGFFDITDVESPRETGASATGERHDDLISTDSEAVAPGANSDRGAI